MKVLLILLIVLIAAFVLVRAYESYQSAATAAPSGGSAQGTSALPEPGDELPLPLDAGGDDHDRFLTRTGFPD
jgi:hypothetical protein